MSIAKVHVALTWRRKTSSQLLLLPHPTTTSTHRLHPHLLPLIPSHLHLPTPQCPKRHNTLTRHTNHTRTSNKPQIHTNTSERRSGKAKQPLDIIRHPALGQPEECFFREVCLQEEAEARGAEPAEGGCGAVEVAAEGLEGLGWEGVSELEAKRIKCAKRFCVYRSSHTRPSSCHAAAAASPIWRSHLGRSCCSSPGSA